MMLAEEHEEEQPAGSIMLAEDFQPPPVVNVDVSDDLLATHITREKKTLFCLPVGVQERTEWALIDTGASRNLISQRAMKIFPSQLPYALQER